MMMVKILLLAASMVVLPGCTNLDTVDRAGDIADRVLAETEATLCSKRFSLRAYERRYLDRWGQLVAFCRWNMTAPIEQE